MIEMVGAWTKETMSECASKYPAFLNFASGTYRGKRGLDQGMVWWDAGIYRLEDNQTKLVVSTATDELITYSIVFHPDRFEVKDAEGCTVTYRRA